MCMGWGWIGRRCSGRAASGWSCPRMPLSGSGIGWGLVGVSVGGGQGWVFTGRLSVETHPWLADHRVFDVVLVPGTAFVEMALAAGVEAGVEGLEELVLEAPLVLPE